MVDDAGTGNIGCAAEAPRDHLAAYPRQGICPKLMDWELEMFLRFGVGALSKLTGRLLKGSEPHPVPLRQKSQVHIAA
jgi:hypothetical protein